MNRKANTVTLLALLLAVSVINTAHAGNLRFGWAMDESCDKVTSDDYFILDKGVARTNAHRPGVPLGPSCCWQDPPGTTIGSTWFEFQHNGSMGRQAVYSPINNLVHFVWACKPSAEDRSRVSYNAYNVSTGDFAWGTGLSGGKEISDPVGVFTTTDVTAAGDAVVAFHQGPPDNPYYTYIDDDELSPNGSFQWVQAPAPPNCEEIVSGSCEIGNEYLWPVIEWQDVGGDSVWHIVSTEYPCEQEGDLDIISIIYYRYVNGTAPACGHFVDSAYTVSAVVRSDVTSQNVAIVYLKPFYYEGYPNDVCGRPRLQNDVVYIESTDGGLSWGTMVNVTDYSQGGTLGSDEIEYKAYTDVSGLYDLDGTLHIVWNTSFHDINSDHPCIPYYASRIWHWDDLDQCISIVYDASHPTYFCPTGVWNMSTAKMNISQCDEKLYVSFTRFGSHTSQDGDTALDCSGSGFYANADIYVVGSNDGGLTWGGDSAPAYTGIGDANGQPAGTGAAVNITNTNTHNCPTGACHSEHWSSMAKYSTDSLHLLYIDDHDAGSSNYGEGDWTENLVKYFSYPCFVPESYCDITFWPLEIGYPMFIAPDSPDPITCTADIDTTFDLTIINSGSEWTIYKVTSNASWLTPYFVTSELESGCDNSEVITYSIGPIVNEGIYTATLDVEACASSFSGSVEVTVVVSCRFHEPDYANLSTACWSLDVSNHGRIGGDQNQPGGNIYWFPPEESIFLYDGSIIITYADDTNQTWFSMYDGSDSQAHFVPFTATNTATFEGFEYATGAFNTPDTAFVMDLEYFLPNHPDTCVLIELIHVGRITLDTVPIHVGYGFDWDVPDGNGGRDNECGVDVSRLMVYQHGPTGSDKEDHYAGVSFTHCVPGAIVLENDEWVYPNAGFIPARIGGLLARHTGFNTPHPDSVEDLTAVYVMAQNDTLERFEVHYYCSVVATSTTGLEDLQDLIDKGKRWIIDHGLACPTCSLSHCPVGFLVGDADGSGAHDIDDVSYMVNCIFTGGPAPVPCSVTSGDADCLNALLDIDDVVYLIRYIFSGGPAPCSCDEWVAIHGNPRDPEACQFAK